VTAAWHLSSCFARRFPKPTNVGRGRLTPPFYGGGVRRPPPYKSNRIVPGSTPGSACENCHGCASNPADVWPRNCSRLGKTSRIPFDRREVIQQRRAIAAVFKTRSAPRARARPLPSGRCPPTSTSLSPAQSGWRTRPRASAAPRRLSRGYWRAGTACRHSGSGGRVGRRESRDRCSGSVCRSRRWLPDHGLAEDVTGANDMNRHLVVRANARANISVEALSHHSSRRRNEQSFPIVAALFADCGGGTCVESGGRRRRGRLQTKPTEAAVSAWSISRHLHPSPTPHARAHRPRRAPGPSSSDRRVRAAPG